MAKIIGLTGGIASGKSTVSSYLIEKELAVVDADQLVRQLQAKGGRLYQVLVTHFGQDILAENGELDRVKLSNRLFSEPSLLAKSAELQDEIIREELAREKDRLAAEHQLVFLDIPLLFEKGYQDWCDEVWLVAVDEKTQLDRLMSRNGYTRQEANQRIASQMSLADKLAQAHRVIDNNGDVTTTYQQVDDYLAELIAH